MKEGDYLRLRRQIENRYAADLEALDRVWRMAHGSNPPKIMADDLQKGDVMRAVRNFVAASKGEPFTLNDVLKTLATLDRSFLAKKMAIRTALKRLLRRHAIEVTESHSGRKQALYTKVATEGQAGTASADEVDSDDFDEEDPLEGL